MIYDITLPLSGNLANWPGDEPYVFSQSASIASGATNNVGVFHSTVHIGTHVDAPFHFFDHGTTIDELNLDIYCGVAAVVDASGRSEITLDVFDDVNLNAVSRVLVKTGAWVDPEIFPTVFPVLAEGVAEYLGEHGVVLFGVDVPSVDMFNGGTLRNHYALANARIAIVESLNLKKIFPGLYEFIALPLKIVGGDGSPVRAILRDLPVMVPEGNRMLGQ